MVLVVKDKGPYKSKLWFFPAVMYEYESYSYMYEHESYSYSGWLLSKSLQAINAGEGVEKREPSYTVGGNAN